MTCKPDPARKLSEVVREESRRPVNLQQGGQTITLPSDQAVVRSITARAIQGNASAQRSFLLLQKELNTPDDVVWKEQLAILIAYKNGWREVLRDSARRHISLPPPDPLPESIEIDEDNRAAYLLAPHEVSSGDCAPTDPQRRRLGAEDYDWLRRNIPDTENTSALNPQPLLSPEETRRLPYHIRVALWTGLKGITDLREGKFVYVAPPRPIFDDSFTTPCERQMPLSGSQGYAVEPDDAEILLSQGWKAIEPDD
jgi:hypothetical protein